MRASKHALLLALVATPAALLVSSCPFANNNNDGTTGSSVGSSPEDEIHRTHRSLRRRLSDTPEKREQVKRIIENRSREQERIRRSHVASGGGGDGGELEPQPQLQPVSIIYIIM